MAFLVREEFCSGLASLPCSLLILRCTGGKLQVRVQEQSAAGVLLVIHPKALGGTKGENQGSVEPSLSVCCAAENRVGKSTCGFVVVKVKRDRERPWLWGLP